MPNSNREYIIQRIKALGFGTFLNNFKWKSGDKWISSNGSEKEWTPDLPSDNDIVFAVFCASMDEQMSSMSSSSTLDKPFTRKYCVFVDQEPNPLEIQIQMKPANYFRIVLGNSSNVSNSSNTNVPNTSNKDVNASGAPKTTSTTSNDTLPNQQQQPNFFVVWNPPYGSSNLFCALVLFIYAVKKYYQGYLGQVYLGSRSINLLQVVND